MCIAVSLRERGVRGIEPLTYKGYETPTNQSLSVAAYHGRTPEPEGKSVPYQSVSHFIRQAVEEFSRVDVRQQIGMMQDLCAFYQKFQNELSWAGSNLNQSVKRANELAVAGLLAPSYVYEVLFPTIQDMQDTLNKMKSDLEILNRKSRLIK